MIAVGVVSLVIFALGVVVGDLDPAQRARDAEQTRGETPRCRPRSASAEIGIVDQVPFESDNRLAALEGGARRGG